MTVAVHRTRGSAAGLIDRLPSVRGRYTANTPLAPYTWFRVGGAAEIVFRPADSDDLASFLGNRPERVPVTVIGATSNLLVRDGGIPGVVIRLTRAFGDIDFSADAVSVGAAVPDANMARASAENGRCGLEFLSGIPGTIGGGLRMNAGAYGGCFGDVVIKADAFDPSGQLRQLAVGEMGMGYRHTGVPDDWIFVSALLRAEPGDEAVGPDRMAVIQAARAATQPVRSRTGGSTFANPEGHKAWELIDRAGCRGLRLGGAMVSQLHCNFLINTGAATAADLENLGKEVRRRVRDSSGIELRWEIRRVGIPVVAEHEA